MKLAEALQERADLNQRIAQLKNRLAANAVVQEGEQPAEDPMKLLAELERDLTRLEELMDRINRTNCATMVDGETLTALLARRDCLTLRLQAYRELTANASQLAHRAMHSEIRILSTVNVKDIQKQIDRMAKELRLLDNQIQQTNWTVEL